jgi:hypothetical protein
MARERSVLTGRYRVPNVSGEIADVSSFLGGIAEQNNVSSSLENIF